MTKSQQHHLEANAAGAPVSCGRCRWLHRWQRAGSSGVQAARAPALEALVLLQVYLHVNIQPCCSASKQPASKAMRQKWVRIEERCKSIIPLDGKPSKLGLSGSTHKSIPDCRAGSFRLNGIQSCRRGICMQIVSMTSNFCHMFSGHLNMQDRVWLTGFRQPPQHILRPTLKVALKLQQQHQLKLLLYLSCSSYCRLGAELFRDFMRNWHDEDRLQRKTWPHGSAPAMQLSDPHQTSGASTSILLFNPCLACRWPGRHEKKILQAVQTICCICSRTSPHC